MIDSKQTKIDAIKQAQYIVANSEQYLLIDVETTGVSDINEVIQLAIINLNGETLLNAYFTPDVSISKHASISNRLDIDTLAARGANCYRDKALEMENKIVLYYANNHFDKRLLNQTAVKYGYLEVVRETIDIMEMRRIAEGDRRSSKNGGTHDARIDALMSLGHLKNIANLTIPEVINVETLAVRRYRLNEQKLTIIHELKDIDAAIKEHMINSGNEAVVTTNGFNINCKLSITGTKLKENVALEDIDDKYIQPATLKASAVKKAIADGIDVSWFATYTEDFNVEVKTIAN